MPRKLPTNPQTTEFLKKLGLENNIGLISSNATEKSSRFVNEEEIKLSEDDQNLQIIQNDEEINLSGEEDNQEELHIDDLDEEDDDDVDDMDDVIDVEEAAEEDENVEILNPGKSTDNDNLINSSEKQRGGDGNNDLQDDDNVGKTEQEVEEILVDQQQVLQFDQRGVLVACIMKV
eukprot:TRINITY_DN28180_c1_g1_i2.p1 TRINITY_DN28180_c1_g1~~TRINITY_DN28180_c1_g1_i2.p1  ORF type:complete len:195 (+),score=62.04 TRINITY_DN28180_c1_g1_i2:60-587(+)